MMPMRKIRNFLSLLISLIGPLTLIFLYAQALIRPQEHASFIFRAGAAIYIIEFLSIHSSGMLLKDHKDTPNKKIYGFFLLGFYAIFTVGFMASLNCWFIGIHFLLSLCTKIFMSRSVTDNINQSQIVFGVINLLCCTFIVVMLASVLKKAFPVPESIASLHVQGTSGLFVDIPQTLLAWGILYFSATVVFNVMMFFKHTPRTEKPSFES
jgi:hypothetical protein